MTGSPAVSADMTSVQKRSLAAVGGATLLAVLGWLAFGFFGVQTLFFDDEVSEENPFAAALETSASDPTETEPTIVAATTAPATEVPAAQVSPTAAPATEPDIEAGAEEVAKVDEPITEPTAEAEVAEAVIDDSEAPADPPATAVPVAASVPQIVTLATGSLVDHDHAGDGSVTVLTDGTQTFLRFEDDFAIDNGPDLNVYLVRGAVADGDPSLFDDDFIDLGDLKGNIGAQNYELPAGIDIGEYDTVAIWCVRFGVAFNAAALA